MTSIRTPATQVLKVVGVHRFALKPGVKAADFEEFMRMQGVPGLGLRGWAEVRIWHMTAEVTARPGIRCRRGSGLAAAPKSLRLPKRLLPRSGSAPQRVDDQ